MFNTKDRMAAFGVRPVKSLGQNFLKDFSVVEDIVDVADLSKEDLVIEIGPGLGVMTDVLADSAGKVIAVEIDSNLIKPLECVRIMHDNIEIINADILKLDIEKDILDVYLKGELKNVKVVANLPYYITTPIIMQLLENNIPHLKLMVFMVQKEVGQRMCALPGGKEYGALSVAVKYFSESKVMFTVPPHCFIPQPNVDSCVIKLTVREEAPFYLKDKDFFFKVVKASFGQRRKMLTNAIPNAAYLNISREEVLEALTELGKDEKIRGEVLLPEEFAKIANLFYKQ